MKTPSRSTSRAIAVALAMAFSAQVPLAQAEIVDTEAGAAPGPGPAELDRAKVQAFMERANVKERMQAMGVSGLVAHDRVASLSEAEVHALAERIDTVPAGGALSNTDLILILLVAILLVVAL